MACFESFPNRQSCKKEDEDHVSLISGAPIRGLFWQRYWEKFIFQRFKIPFFQRFKKQIYNYEP